MKTLDTLVKEIITQLVVYYINLTFRVIVNDCNRSKQTTSS